MKLTSFASLLLVAAPLAAQDSTARPAPAPAAPAAAPRVEVPVDRVVAVVGDQPILWSGIQEVVYERRSAGIPIPTDSAGGFALAREILDDLIDQELLLAKARQAKIEVTDDEVNDRVDAQVKQIRARFRTELEYREALRQSGFGTPEDYRRGYVERMRREALQQRVLEQMRQEGKLIAVPVNEADVREAFEKNRNNFPKRPAMIGFRQVVVATRPSPAAKEVARVKAESLLAEIRRGADFEQVAKRESMDQANREVGGDLGWIRRGATVPEFERWVFALVPGTMSPVVETVYGYHIIRVDRVQPAEVKVRHILIMPTTDSTDTRRGRALADSVAALWRGGASYDTLAVRFHDDAGQEERVLPEYDRSQLPPAYQAAFEGKANGDIVGPFEIPNPRGAPKHVVAQITTLKEGGEYTVADLKQTIRDQIAQERSIRRFLDGLKREIFVGVYLDEATLAQGPAATP